MGGSVKSLNGKQLSGEYIKKIANNVSIPNCNLNDDDSLSFNLSFNDERLSDFFPFCSKSNSVHSITPIPISLNDKNRCSNSPNIMEQDTFSDHSSEREDNYPNLIPKQVRFVNDGYCTECQQQFNGS